MRMNPAFFALVAAAAAPLAFVASTLATNASAPVVSAGRAPALIGADGPPPAASLVLTGRVIDGTGAPPIERGVVVIEGERIRCVGVEGVCSHPRGARALKVPDGTILPGLIDLHVHSRPHYLTWFLPAGVTTIRDANNSLETIEELSSVHAPATPSSGAGTGLTCSSPALPEACIPNARWIRTGLRALPAPDQVSAVGHGGSFCRAIRSIFPFGS